MFTKIMKFICAVALLVAAFWRASAGADLVLDILICVGAVVVSTQAVTRSKYLWAAGFAAIAVLFNPVVPVVFSRGVFLWLDVACLLAFLVSLAVMRRRPILSIPSITDRTPGSESL
jgi:Family of unknown function (DUF6804)